MTVNQNELEKLLEWRREVLTEVFKEVPDESLMLANKEYFESMPFDHTFINVDGDDIACGIVCYQDELPSPDNRSGKCGYIMNVYVRKAYRHQGYGKMTVNRLINFARAKGCGKIYLETTDMARKLYTECGFMPIKDMMKL